MDLVVEVGGIGTLNKSIRATSFGETIALIGVLADKAGIQNSFVIPIFCYLYIAYYGLWGSKPSRTVAA